MCRIQTRLDSVFLGNVFLGWRDLKTNLQIKSWAFWIETRTKIIHKDSGESLGCSTTEEAMEIQSQNIFNRFLI